MILLLGGPVSEPLTASVLQGPSHITFDSDRNLWVAGFARVLRFSFPNSSGERGSLVIGKPNFVTPDENPSPITASSLWAASDVAFDQSGNMCISDNNAERILMYETNPNLPDFFLNGQEASIVLGRPDFTSVTKGSDNCTASTIFSPQSIAFDLDGNLWATDLGYNRVLKYSTPFSNGQDASLVIGQSSFTAPPAEPHISTNPSPTSLDFPGGIAFDELGNLWVADSGHNRILRYSRPFSKGQAASLVIGKQDFTS